MVTDDRREPEGRRGGVNRETGERPGRRALFSPATPPTRKARAPVSPPEVRDETTTTAPPAPAPSLLAGVLERAVTDRAPLDPGAVDEVYGPVVMVVNRLLEELAETRARLERAEEEAARRPEMIVPGPARKLRPAVEIHDLPLPALLVGRDLGLLDATEAFSELCGLTAEALVGTPMSRFIRRRDGDPPVLALRREAPTRATVSLDTADGEARFVEYASPVRNDVGEVEGLVVIYASEPVSPVQDGDGFARLFEALMQEAPLPIALLDASFRVLDHTPAFGALLGLDDAWLADHMLADLHLVEETGPTLDEIVDRGEEAFGEVVIELGGERRRLERYALPVRDAAGQFFRLLVTFMDRTDGDLQANRIAGLEERAALLQEQDQEQMADLEHALLCLSEGDLDHSIEFAPDSRFASLASSFNLATEKLRGRITTLGARSEVVPSETTPDPDGRMMMSAAEITGLLLGALTGERGERLLLDEADPLMPLRAEVNEALDRLESVPEGQNDLVLVESAPLTGPIDEPDLPGSGQEVLSAPFLSPDELPRNAPEQDLPVLNQTEPEPPIQEEITLYDQIMQPSVPPSPEVMSETPVGRVSLPGMEGFAAPAADPAAGLGADVEVVTFEMAGQQYALDIRLAREIVEMIPITPIPRSPSHITGIINLRGEITTILNLYQLLGLPDPGTGEGQKIVVLVPEAADGSNVGIIVDNVHSVNQVPAHRIELKGEGSSADYTGFVRGIIRQESTEGEEDQRNLVIWIDMPAILEGLIAQSS